jgi:(p)ppGpp synthase/HD superfamily hydrolase
MSQKNIREFIRIVLKEEKDLDSAQILSQWAHQGQKRRSGEPYFLHPQEVAYIIKRYYSDLATYYAAMLHDALEDGIPLGNIQDEEEFFDLLAAELPATEIERIDDIYNSIIDLTKPDGADYFSYVTNLIKNPIAFRVKLADIMQNISDNPSKRQLKKYVKTKDLLVDQFKNNVPPGISPEHWESFKKVVDNAAEK